MSAIERLVSIFCENVLTFRYLILYLGQIYFRERGMSWYTIYGY